MSLGDAFGPNARGVFTGDDGGVVFCGDAYEVNERALAVQNIVTTGASHLSSMRTQHEALHALGLARKITKDPRPFGSTPPPTEAPEAASEGDVASFIEGGGIGVRAPRRRSRARR